MVKGYAALAGFLLDLVATRYWTMVPMVALLLAVHTILLAVLSFVLIALHCILILRLYWERSAALTIAVAEPALGNREQELVLPGWHRFCVTGRSQSWGHWRSSWRFASGYSGSWDRPGT